MNELAFLTAGLISVLTMSISGLDDVVGPQYSILFALIFLISTVALFFVQNPRVNVVFAVVNITAIVTLALFGASPLWAIVVGAIYAIRAGYVTAFDCQYGRVSLSKREDSCEPTAEDEDTE